MPTEPTPVEPPEIEDLSEDASTSEEAPEASEGACSDTGSEEEVEKGLAEKIAAGGSFGVSETASSTEEEEDAEAETAEEEEEELSGADIWSNPDLAANCEIEEEEEEEICYEECATCTPTPDAPVPDWRFRTTPFLNKKTCHYCVTIYTSYETPEELLSETTWEAIKEAAKIDGIAQLLKYYTKSLEFTGPVDPCSPLTAVVGDQRLGGGALSGTSKILEGLTLTSEIAKVDGTALGGPGIIDTGSTRTSETADAPLTVSMSEATSETAEIDEDTLTVSMSEATSETADAAETIPTDPTSETADGSDTTMYDETEVADETAEGPETDAPDTVSECEVEALEEEAEEAEEEETPEEDTGDLSATTEYLMEYADADRWYRPATANTRIRILVCIPAGVFDAIPPSTVDGQSTPYTAGEIADMQVSLPTEVTFNTETFSEQLKDVRWLMKHYGNKRVPMEYQSDGTIIKETFNGTGYESAASWNEYLHSKYGETAPSYKNYYWGELITTQADNLMLFSDALKDLFRNNTSGWIFGWWGEHSKKSGIEKIVINFYDDYRIKSVTFNKHGCPPITLTSQAEYELSIQLAAEEEEYYANPFINPEIVPAQMWEEFVNSYPQTDPRTMAYVSSLPHMQEVSKQTTPMQWQDFLTVWTWPPVEIMNFDELDDNDPPCSNASDALGNILQSTADVFIEMLTANFDQALCASITDADAQNWFDGKPLYGGGVGPFNNFGENSKGVMQAATISAFKGDPFLGNIIENLDVIANTDGFWAAIMHKLGRCGWLGLLDALLKCLLNGLDFSDMLEVLVRAMIKNMAGEMFRRLLLGLPESVQDAIAASAAENIPAAIGDWRPWGNDGGLERTMERARLGHFADAIDSNNLPSAAKAAAALQALDESAQLAEDDYTGEYESTVLSQTTRDYLSNSGFSEKSLGELDSALAGLPEQAEALDERAGWQDQRDTKTLGKFLVDTEVIQSIKDAYVDALLEFLTPAELLELVEQLPGFAFLAELGELLKCPAVSIFHPPLAEWFNDFMGALSAWDWGLCKDGKPFRKTAIGWNLPFLTWDMFSALAEIFLEMLAAALLQAMFFLIKKLIEWILSTLCALMGTLGAAVGAALGVIDQTEFMDIFKEQLCGSNATDAEIESSLETILETLGVTESATEEELAGTGETFLQELGAWFEGVPIVDALDMMSGNPSTPTLANSAEYWANSSFPVLGGKHACRDFFSTLGQVFLGPDFLDKITNIYETKAACAEGASFCRIDGLSQYQDALADAYDRLGFDPDSIAEMVQLDEEMKKEEFADISNAREGDLGTPDFSSANLQGVNGEPLPCAGLDNPLTGDDPLDLIDNEADSEATVADLQGEYEDELIGDGGYFDRLLSDCDGRGRNQHNRRLLTLLDKEYADNPETVGKYLHDILTGDRTDISVQGADGISASDSTAYNLDGEFSWIEFDVSGLSNHALEGGWSNNAPVLEKNSDGDKVYVWSYNRTWKDDYKYRSELSSGDINDYDCEEGRYAMWDVTEAMGGANFDGSQFDSDKVKYRKFKFDAAKWHDYPNPHCIMRFMGTDPSYKWAAAKNAGQPTYHFHFWHWERYGREEAGSTWYSAEEELAKDTCKLHIFQVLPGEDADDDSLPHAEGIGEYSRASKDVKSGCGDSEDLGHGNIMSFYNGFGPLSNSDRANCAVDPIIKVTRTIPDYVQDSISELEIDLQEGYSQKGTVFAKHVTNILYNAIAETRETEPTSDDVQALDNIYSTLLGSEYNHICKEFIDQYGRQLADSEELWESGLLQFVYEEMTEDEAIEEGLPTKGDDDKEVIKNYFWKRGDEDTGWYRPEVVESTMGTSENVNLPEDEYGIAAYYVHQQYNRGWARLSDEYLPGKANPCEEQISADVFGWSEISDHMTKMKSELQDDQRVSANPSCAWDPPFDRINDRTSKAEMEGYIRATMRVSIFEFLLKGTAAFSKFDPSAGVFGDLFPAYVFANLREQLFQASRRQWGWFGPGRIKKGHNRYDYKFLEQACTMYVRGVQRGEYELTVDCAQAVDKIDDIINRVYYQPAFDLFHAKKKALLRKCWEEAEPHAMIIARELFKHEFETCTKKFSEFLSPEVDDLGIHFLQGGLSLSDAVTSARATDIAKSLDEERFTEVVYETISATEAEELGYSTTISELIQGRDLKSDWKYLETGGFVIEKYIKIEDYEERGDLDAYLRDDELFGAVNLQSWQGWLDENPTYTTINSTTTDEFGAEIPDLTDQTEHTLGDDTIADHFAGWKYGVRLSYVPSFDKSSSAIDWVKTTVASVISNRHMAFEVEDLSTISSYETHQKLVASTEWDPMMLIPIASAEVEIPSEMKIKNLDIVNDYDFDCMIAQLREEAHYKMLFEYAFPLDRFLSLPTIYTAHCFLDSVGMDDGWYQAIKLDPENPEEGLIGDPSMHGNFRKKTRGHAKKSGRHGMMAKMFNPDGPGLEPDGFWVHMQNKSYRNWDKVCFKSTKDTLHDKFEGSYDWKGQFSRNRPKFSFKFPKLGPWSIRWYPKWMMNRMLEGPDCDDDAAADAAERAAYNSS